MFEMCFMFQYMVSLGKCFRGQLKGMCGFLLFSDVFYKRQLCQAEC